jgi:hypothetical protein
MSGVGSGGSRACVTAHCRLPRDRAAHTLSATGGHRNPRLVMAFCLWSAHRGKSDNFLRGRAPDRSLVGAEVVRYSVSPWIAVVVVATDLSRPEGLRLRRRVHPRPLEEPGCRVRSRSTPLPRSSPGPCIDARRHRGVAQGHSAIAAGSRRRAHGARGGFDAVAPGRPDGLGLRGSGTTMVTNGERGRAMRRVSQPLRVAHLDVHCAPSLDIHAEPWIQPYLLGRTFKSSVRAPRWKSADSHSTAHLSRGLRAQYADVALERDAAARLIKEAIRS